MAIGTLFWLLVILWAIGWIYCWATEPPRMKADPRWPPVTLDRDRMRKDTVYQIRGDR